MRMRARHVRAFDHDFDSALHQGSGVLGVDFLLGGAGERAIRFNRPPLAAEPVPRLQTRALLAERLYGDRFVVLHIEDGIELRDLQEVMNSLGQVQQF